MKVVRIDAGTVNKPIYTVCGRELEGSKLPIYCYGEGLLFSLLREYSRIRGEATT